MLLVAYQTHRVRTSLLTAPVYFLVHEQTLLDHVPATYHNCHYMGYCHAGHKCIDAKHRRLPYKVAAYSDKLNMAVGIDQNRLPGSDDQLVIHDGSLQEGSQLVVLRRCLLPLVCDSVSSMNFWGSHLICQLSSGKTYLLHFKHAPACTRHPDPPSLDAAHRTLRYN